MKPVPRALKPGGRITPECTVVAPLTPKRQQHPVYLVWHHGDWCPMAGKVVRSAERAMEEAAVLQRLSHPNIVRALGVYNNVLLLEYLHGETLDDLRERLPDQRMPLSQALRAAAHLGAALEHVHRQGYVHLDVKPCNVMVASGRPILFDFGSARPLSAKRPKRALGTTIYMSPEEAALMQVSPASDVFSFGVSLYELLTGRLPFPKPSRKDPFPQLNAEPTPPRNHLKSMPRRLEELILQCLARDPDHRPKLRELLPELNSHIKTGPRMWPAEVDPAAGPGKRKLRNRELPA